jgi:outer membrane protein OmpA-like peptidoglycan-associated protein/tetratricopeptide (TPR) repeat protein
MKKIVTLTLLALIFSLNGYAQKAKTHSKNIGTQLKIADKFYAESYFYTAAEYYRDALRQDSTSRYAAFWLAMSLLQSRDYEGAEVFFDKFYSMQPGEKTNTKKWEKENQILFNKGGFYYAQVLHRNGKYDKAIESLGKFRKEYTAKDENDLLPTLAKRLQESCEFARNNKVKAKVKIINAGAGVNRSYNEGGPFGVGEDKLYYSALKVDGMSTGDTLIFVKGNKSKRVYQIYTSNLAGNDWSRGKAVENEDINTDGYIVGNGAFNGDMSRFYFTKCLEMDDDRSLCNIFVADHSNGTFSNVTRIPDPINEKERYTATQPTVRSARDGMEMIYFVTDRPGGAGGMDIWYFNREPGGTFVGPKPLVGPVNTAGDELTPYFNDSTGTLYFSSDGHPGYGGLDIFSTVENADLTWSPITNLGVPVNSGADDLYYSRSTDQTRGFLVSNRVGGVPLNGIKTASDDIYTWSNLKYAVQGIAFKEGNEGGGALEGATFKLYRKAPDGSKILVSVDSSRRDGSYFFKLQPETDYLVEVERPGFTTKVEAVTTVGLDNEDTLNNNINIRKATFILKGLLTEDGKPGVGVKDASVTLVEVYPNGLEKTVYYMNSDPNFYFELEKNKKYKIITRKNEYFAKTNDINTTGIETTDTLTKEYTIAKLEINKEYTLQNVLYEFGKATLTENSKNVLNSLYQILVENPAFIIELSAHTDAIGSDAANMKLSQARAESCVKYLIGKGVAKDRLVAKGYGETRPKVPNMTEDGKDDPAGRAINRRTEFKITGLKQDQ